MFLLVFAITSLSILCYNTTLQPDSRLLLKTSSVPRIILKSYYNRRHRLIRKVYGRNVKLEYNSDIKIHMCILFTDNTSRWKLSEDIERPLRLSCYIILLYFQLGIIYLSPYQLRAAREMNFNISLL